MTDATSVQLPDDIDALKAFIVEREQIFTEREKTLSEQEQLISSHQKRIAFLEETIRFLKAQRFGRSSERFESANQENLFNEAEELDSESVEEEHDEHPEIERVPGTRRSKPSKTRGRKPLPKDLPRVQVFHEIEDEERQCACGHELEAFGEVISEKLGIIPAEFFVIQNCRKKYRCPCCVDQAPVTAPMPPQPFPKSNASPELVAHVAIAKFLDGLPFYRQEKMWQRLDIDMPRATLANWTIAGGRLTEPLIKLLKDRQNTSAVMHIDETPTQVLKEPDKPPTGNKYFWVTASGPPDRPVYLFHYNPSRGSEVADTLLEDFQGTVISDDWHVYARVCEKRHLRHIACNDHARRKFADAVKAAPKNKSGKLTKPEMALNFYQKLYGVERKIKDLSAEAKYEVRQKESVPVWKQFIAWMEKHIHQTTPESKFGKALHYTYKLRDKLRFYCEDGNLPMSNQVAENAIRPFAIARKNFLFYDTPKGAQASANLYSLIMTAKSHGLDPFFYLAYVFKHLPMANTLEDLEKLAPWAVDSDQIRATFNYGQ